MIDSFLLAINSAEGLLQLVLGKDSPEGIQLVWSESLPAASQGAELLAPALVRGIESLGVTPAQIRRIACVAGPGSFTGLRLASATAAGLAAATGAQQAGLPLLPLLAASAAEATAWAFGAEGTEAAELAGGAEATGSAETAGVSAFGSAASTPPVFAVLTHARRDLVHFQMFHWENGTPHALTEILVLDPASAVARILAEQPQAYVLGSGVGRNPQAFEGQAVRLLGPAFDHPSPAVLVRAADAAVFGPDPVVPLYVRPSDAEENLPALAVALGLNPEEAATALRVLSAEIPGKPSADSPDNTSAANPGNAPAGNSGNSGNASATTAEGALIVTPAGKTA